MKGYELKVKHQVNSRVSLIKKGKARKYWKRESLKNLYVVKMRKKICILLVATFLEDRRMNKQLQVFLWEKWWGGGV